MKIISVPSLLVIGGTAYLGYRRGDLDGSAAREQERIGTSSATTPASAGRGAVGSLISPGASDQASNAAEALAAAEVVPQREHAT